MCISTPFTGPNDGWNGNHKLPYESNVEVTLDGVTASWSMGHLTPVLYNISCAVNKVTKQSKKRK